jgi:HlyD family secretion protein
VNPRVEPGRSGKNIVLARSFSVTYQNGASDPRAPEAEADSFEPKASLRRPATIGLAAILFGFGGFLLWSISANVDSAAVAYGNVITDSKTKTITHLEGGILKSILVSEGDKVTEGQPLIALDDTRAASDVAALTGARAGLLAKLARLRAEQGGKPEIDFPQALTDDPSTLATSVIEDERQLFSQRQSIFGAKIEAAKKQIEQTVAQASAFAAQRDAAEKQRALIEQQLARVRTLVDKGLSTEREATLLEAQLSQIVGNVGQYASEKARAEQQKAEAEVALLSVEMEWRSEIASDTQDTQLKLNEIEQRLAIAKDVRNRLIVRAPHAGTVLNLQFRTPGSAVPAGAPLLEIAPDADTLVVEARLRPMDIDAVHVGGPVAIRLTAYNLRTHPPLDGTLSYVAADQTEDTQRGVSYYTVRATIDPASLSAHPSMRLYPGMPAELVAKIEPRLAIDYLLDPLTQTFYRAFREE